MYYKVYIYHKISQINNMLEYIMKTINTQLPQK